MAFSKIELPELFFGFVAPVGVDLRPSLNGFRSSLEGNDYKVVEIKITDSFRSLKEHLIQDFDLKNTTEYDRYISHIDLGNKLRGRMQDDSFLSAIATFRILYERTKIGDVNDRYSGVAYLIDQLKRQEEIDLLRTVYGRLFFQVSIYSRRTARVDFLARKFSTSENSVDAASFRSKAESVISTDEHQREDKHGQRVRKIFAEADFIVNSDVLSPNTSNQIARFIDLVFGSNSVSPTAMEYGMFAAKAAALRTLDLSRQVGAAIFSNNSEIITMGSNEVPKAGGGSYWADNEFDAREYTRGHDTNEIRKSEILRDLLNRMGLSESTAVLMEREEVQESQFMDALEYGRIVHAEMSAICDAARLGRSLKGAILYCTTYPCHMCANTKSR